MLLLAAAAAGLFAAGALRRSGQDDHNEQEKDLVETLLLLPDSSAHSFRLGENIFSFEVVNTPVSRGQGLSGREEIGSDGMLFVFSNSDRHTFWMKDMDFDLDMIWIVDEEVVEITESVSAPQTTTEARNLSIYQPNTPVNLVLEVVAGFVEEHGLEPGARIILIDK